MASPHEAGPAALEALPGAFAPYLRAAQSESPEFELRDACGPLLDTCAATVAAAYGGVLLGSRSCARALARVVPAIAERELRAGGTPEPGAILSLLVLRDLGLVQAALEQDARAWMHLATLVRRAVRVLALRLGSGRRGRQVAEELEENLLGSMFLKGKLGTYRATAPVIPWLRQVACNRARERMSEIRRAEELSRPLAESEDGLAEPGSGRRRGPWDPRILVEEEEIRAVLAWALPRVLDTFSAEEREMLQRLSQGEITQVELCQQFGVSPFTLNRWYREVRERFRKRLVREAREALGLHEAPAGEILGLLGFPQDS
jgi:DNA-directed RNA polymerase specialized sigma24 family protein